ncbi:endonuclease/exonuclease/phosphatase family protein [Streptomyces sp. bgisy126]|uniref:endonuclease/exonuclease/phosphatase family protein n=1 Tax=unclassified Streptomyces TaxID=2593676 RepID=UPI003EBBFA6A
MGWREGRRTGSGRRPGWVVGGVAVAAAVLLLFHRAVPGPPGGLLASFLPWLGPLVVVLSGLALLRRSGIALAALVLPAAAWAYAFGGLLLPGEGPGSGPYGLVVVQHNVSDENPDPAGTARALAAAGPDLVALEELVPPALSVYEEVLAPEYPYRAVHGTVGLWSRHPLTGVRPVNIKPPEITEPWERGLRAVARTPRGDVAVYVAHLPSVRIGAGGLASSRRDESARRLGDAVAAEEVAAVVLLGDLNGTVDDRGLDPLTSRLGVARRGLAPSFPAAFPVARIDQVMARSATVGRIRTLPATGSDHLPVLARVTLR